MIYFVLLGLAVLFIWIYAKFFKKLRCGNMICITGGIKTGKSMLGVRQALQLLKSQRRKVWIYNRLRYIAVPFNGFKVPKSKPRPLLYSNIPLAVPYVPMNRDLLLRQERFVYGSVVYLCEASLVADSMSYKDPFVNECLLLFNKLFAHETRGGYLIYDTQSISDNHFAVKRCLNSYFYIHHMLKVPFFCVMFIREERYSEDNNTVNTFEEDVEKSLLVHLVPKSVWKKYDCYCYSALTDNLPEISTTLKTNDLKARDIVSFKHYHHLKGGKDN